MCTNPKTELAILLAALVAAVGPIRGVVAQTAVNFNVAGPATWTDIGSWDTFQVPVAQFNEYAVIGGDRSAYVDNTPPDVGAIVVSAGTLEIRPGGSLTATPNTLVAGNLLIGDAGTGNVIVRRGGTLNVHSVSTFGTAASQLTLGETGGAGTAVFQTTGGTLSRVTRMVGPNVNFASSGNLAFASPGVLIPVITGATHSTINVTGTGSLGGTVRPEFNGYTPVLGNSWHLVTATQLSGSFAIDASQAPDTPRGTGFAVTRNSTTATLRYMSKLLLTVDRASGLTKIENVVGSPISFDAYSVASAGGNLDGAWISLADQAISGWDEADNSNVMRLTEFRQSGTSTINVGASLPLGNPYSPPVPTAIGQSVAEDLSFQYAVPGQGTIEGIVEYTGRRNNVVLTINPATGASAIQNESPFFNVEIEAYTVTSASGRLQAGAGQWNSLQDQGLAAWDEADNSNNFRLTEFKTSGTTPLAGGGIVLNLGTAVNIAGPPLDVEDFQFEFVLSNGQVIDGIVALGTLPSAVLVGDYDHNGLVNTADYTAWRTAFGNSVTPGSGADGNSNGVIDAADYVVWRNALSGGSASATAAVMVPVPEPASAMYATLLLACGIGVVRVRRGDNRVA